MIRNYDSAADSYVGTTSAAASAAAVANEFIKLGIEESGVPSVDQMKLQKLLFYAHAWHLAIHNRPLFEEDFEAWPWGPVVRNVYYETKKYGRNRITSPIHDLKIVDDHGGFDVKFYAPTIPDSAAGVRDFLRAVWDAHKNFTGIQLSNATHAPGEPWTIVRDRYGSLGGKPTIPNELIAAVFRKKLNNVAKDPES
ncbi:DUF4065 domain-containing protein [Geminicoccaceae bacterium 1502E]|nr:DUF4065 domain-containing protein [Geminicoccaceae bacterium 1502E]